MGSFILIFALALKLVASIPYYDLVDSRQRQHDLRPTPWSGSDVRTTTVEVEGTIAPRRLSTQVRETPLTRNIPITYRPTRKIYEQDWVKLQNPLQQNREIINENNQTPFKTLLETEIKSFPIIKDTVPIIQETNYKTIDSPLRVIEDDDYSQINKLESNIASRPLIQTQRQIVRGDTIPRLVSQHETLPLVRKDKKVIYKQRLENPQSEVLIREQELAKPLPTTTRVEAEIDIVPTVVQEMTVEVGDSPILKTRESKLSIPTKRNNIDPPIINKETDIVVEDTLSRLRSSNKRILGNRQSKRQRLSQKPSNDVVTRVESIDNIKPGTTVTTVETSIKNNPKFVQESVIESLDKNINRKIYDNSEANSFINRFLTPLVQKQRSVVYDNSLPGSNYETIYERTNENIPVIDQYILKSRPIATSVDQDILTVPRLAQKSIREYDFVVPNEDISVSNQYILKSRPIVTRSGQDIETVPTVAQESIREYDYTLPSSTQRQVAQKYTNYYDKIVEINENPLRDTIFHEDYLVQPQPITTRFATDIDSIPTADESNDIPMPIRGISEYENSFSLYETPSIQNKRDILVYGNILPDIRSRFLSTSPSLQEETFEIYNPEREVVSNNDYIIKTNPVARNLQEDIQTAPVILQKSIVEGVDDELPPINKYDYLTSGLLRSHYRVPLREKEVDTVYFDNYAPRSSSNFNSISTVRLNNIVKSRPTTILESEILAFPTFSKENFDSSPFRRINDREYSASASSPVLQTEDIEYNRLRSLRSNNEQVGKIRQYDIQNHLPRDMLVYDIDYEPKSQPDRTISETDIQSVPINVRRSAIERFDDTPYRKISQYNYINPNNFQNNYEIEFQKNSPIYQRNPKISQVESVTNLQQNDLIFVDDDTYGTVYQTYQSPINPYKTIESTNESPVRTYETLHQISRPSQKYYEPYIQNYQSRISHTDNIYDPTPIVRRRKRRDVSRHESDTDEIEDSKSPRTSRLHYNKVTSARQSPFDDFMLRDQSYRSPLETTHVDLEIFTPQKIYQSLSSNTVPQLQEQENIHLNTEYTSPSYDVLPPRLPTHIWHSSPRKTDFNWENLLQNLERTSSIGSPVNSVSSLNRRLSNYDNIDGTVDRVYSNDRPKWNTQWISKDIVSRPSFAVDDSVILENINAPNRRYLQPQVIETASPIAAYQNIQQVRGPQVQTTYPPSSSFVIQETQPAYSYYSTSSYPFGLPATTNYANSAFVANPACSNHPNNALTVAPSGGVFSPLVNPYANAVSSAAVANAASNAASLASSSTAVTSPLVQNRDSVLISNAASDAAAAAAAANSAALDVANLVALLNSAYLPIKNAPATQVTTVDVVEKIPSSTVVQTVDVSAQYDPTTIAANAAASAVASTLSSLKQTNTLNSPIRTARTESISISTSNKPQPNDSNNPVNTANVLGFLGHNQINGAINEALIANVVSTTLSSLLSSDAQQGSYNSQISIDDKTLIAEITAAAVNAALKKSFGNSGVVTETVSTSVLPLKYSSSVTSSADDSSLIAETIAEAIAEALNKPSSIVQSSDSLSIQEIIASSVANAVQSSIAPILRLSQSNVFDNADLVITQDPLANKVLTTISASSPKVAALISSDTAATKALINVLSPFLKNNYQKSRSLDVASELAITDTISSEILASAIISALSSAQPNTVSALISDAAAIETLSSILSNLPSNEQFLEEQVINQPNVETLLKALSLPIVRGRSSSNENVDNTNLAQLVSLSRNSPIIQSLVNPYIQSKINAAASNAVSENILATELSSNFPYSYPSSQAILEGNAAAANLAFLNSPNVWQPLGKTSAITARPEASATNVAVAEALSSIPSNNVYYNTLKQPLRIPSLSNPASFITYPYSQSSLDSLNSATATSANSNVLYGQRYNPTSFDISSKNVLLPNPYFSNQYPYSLVDGSVAAKSSANAFASGTLGANLASASADASVIGSQNLIGNVYAYPSNRYTSNGNQQNSVDIATTGAVATGYASNLPVKSGITYPSNSYNDRLRLEEEAIAAKILSNVESNIFAGNSNILASPYNQVRIVPSTSANAISTASVDSSSNLLPNSYNKQIVESLAGTRVTNGLAQADAALALAEKAAIEAARFELAAESVAAEASYEAQQAALKQSLALQNAGVAAQISAVAETKFEETTPLVD